MRSTRPSHKEIRGRGSFSWEGALLTFSASLAAGEHDWNQKVCGDGLPAPGNFQRSNVTLRRWDLALKEHCVLLEMCIFMPWLQVRPGLLFLPGKGIRLHRIMQHIESSPLGNNLERGSGLSLCDWRETGETGALCDSLHKNSTQVANSGKAETSSSNGLASGRSSLGVNAAEQDPEQELGIVYYFSGA